MKGLCVLQGARRTWRTPCHPSLIVKRTALSLKNKPSPTQRHLLPTTPARTRFAPSPTGFLHIGSLRTALYNYLLAKATGGQFLLRIEDTDRIRLVPHAEEELQQDLRWSGLDWDEGPDKGGAYGPYRQSERLHLYRKHADDLLGNGRAYRCFCRPEDEDQMKVLALRVGQTLPRGCGCSQIPLDDSASRAASHEPHCVRFVGGPSPQVQDLVFGTYTRPEQTDDFILIKRDGFPTYHFANVVDDYLMKITHVIRGEEWLMSTPMHVALYEALGWKPPEFAHVGLLVTDDNQKLSKRNAASRVDSWRDSGYLPVALLNYVMLLGWSAGNERGKDHPEIMDLEQMIAKFSFRFTKGNVKINQKYTYTQKQHSKRLEAVGSTAPWTEGGLDRMLTLIYSTEKLRRETITVSEGQRGSEASSGATLKPEKCREWSGVIGPPLFPDTAGQVDAADGLQHFFKAFQGGETGTVDPIYWIDRHLYLIWDVPDRVYEDALRTQLKNGWLAKRPNPLASLYGLIQRVREVLLRGQNMPEQQAVQEDIIEELKLMKEPALLRWVFFGGRPGLALFQMMRQMGPDLLLQRLDRAERHVYKAVRADPLAAGKSIEIVPGELERVDKTLTDIKAHLQD
ncbi:hypothetical protein GGR56DRAFT_627559 [Xylariaceae sp. FL0804]|nr:hypothetical protein GGR56DRAFT_627559 [Xylariaceae sp. FL0804]